MSPNRESAFAALHKVDPKAYAATRNNLNGAVTRLSPWITHGVISTREVAEYLLKQYGLGFDHKLVFELAWREFFQHVLAHEGERIFSDLRSPFYKGKYSSEIPEDFLHAKTGLAPIDHAVQTLYSTGYLHNHLRMWLASYLIHMRKVRWQAGADWMISHLLDGDVASNHLSWQWVAGTFSNKPYLFNASNVAKYAPSLACYGSSIDTDYEHLAMIATEGGDIGREPLGRPEGLTPPKAFASFDDALPNLVANSLLSVSNLPTPESLQFSGIQFIEVVTPFNLGAIHQTERKRTFRLGLVDERFHQRFLWSAKRWHWVCEGFELNCDHWLTAKVHELQDLKLWLRQACSNGIQVRLASTLQPVYRDLDVELDISKLETPPLFPELNMLQSSFSKYYRKVCQRAGSLDKLLSS